MLDRWRSTALIGIASAAAAMAATYRTPAPAPELERPDVREIVIGRDTVWFCAEMARSRGNTAFAFTRQSRRWIRPASMGPCPAAFPPVSDTSTAGDGVVATFVRPPDDNGKSVIRLSDAKAGRTALIRPPADPGRLKALLPDAGFANDPVGSISATAVTDSLVWLGLRGDFSEGDGTVGGLIRLERMTGKWEWIVDPQLAPNTVAGLAVAGGSLWVALTTPGYDREPLPTTGLQRRDLRGKLVKVYTDSASPLMSTTITGLRTDGRVLAMSTDMGLSVIELRDGPADAPLDDAIARWNNQLFVPAFAGDTLIFDLAPTRPLDQKLEAAASIAQHFGVPGRDRPLVEALSKLPTRALVDAANTDDDSSLGGASLADTAGTDAFIMLLGGRSMGKQLAAEAIRTLGSRTPPALVNALRTTFLALDTTSERSEIGILRRELGTALVATGDTSVTTWAFGALEKGIRTIPSGTTASEPQLLELQAAIPIVAAAHDARGLSLIMAATPLIPPYLGGPTVEALVEYGTPQAWGALIAFARANQLPRNLVLPSLNAGVMTDRVVAMRARDLLREELADGRNAVAAANAARRLGLIELVPDLISGLVKRVGRSGFQADYFYEALIGMTGRADAPAYGEAFPASAANWWNTWATENAGKMTAVSQQAGDDAVKEWKKKRRAAMGRPPL